MATYGLSWLFSNMYLIFSLICVMAIYVVVYNSLLAAKREEIAAPAAVFAAAAVAYAFYTFRQTLGSVISNIGNLIIVILGLIALLVFVFSNINREEKKGSLLSYAIIIMVIGFILLYFGYGFGAILVLIGLIAFLILSVASLAKIEPGPRPPRPPKPPKPEKFKLTVFVKDTKGFPVKDAVVAVGGKNKKTNKNGETKFKLPRGRYTVTASHTLYPPASGVIELTHNDTITLVLGKSEPEPEPDDPKKHLSSLVVKVIDGKTKNPIPEATVNLYAVKGARLQLSGKTDNNGSVKFDKLLVWYANPARKGVWLPVVYGVIVHKEGYISGSAGGIYLEENKTVVVTVRLFKRKKQLSACDELKNKAKGCKRYVKNLRKRIFENFEKAAKSDPSELEHLRREGYLTEAAMKFIMSIPNSKLSRDEIEEKIGDFIREVLYSRLVELSVLRNEKLGKDAKILWNKYGKLGVLKSLDDYIKLFIFLPKENRFLIETLPGDTPCIDAVMYYRTKWKMAVNSAKRIKGSKELKKIVDLLEERKASAGFLGGPT